MAYAMASSGLPRQARGRRAPAESSRRPPQRVRGTTGCWRAAEASRPRHARRRLTEACDRAPERIERFLRLVGEITLVRSLLSSSASSSGGSKSAYRGPFHTEQPPHGGRPASLRVRRRRGHSGGRRSISGRVGVMGEPSTSGRPLAGWVKAASALRWSPSRRLGESDSSRRAARARGGTRRRRLSRSIPDARHSSSASRSSPASARAARARSVEVRRRPLPTTPRHLLEACRAGEDSLADCMRDLRLRRRENLGHEERISCGLPKQLVGVDAMRLRQLREGGSRKRSDVEPPHRSRSCERPEQDPQRVAAIELVVSIRENDQSR